MKIPNDALWKEFQKPGPCELCGKPCRAREPHHLWTRTPEITSRINLISLGSTMRFLCSCHSDVGAGKIPFIRLLETVAARERVRPEDIMDVMNLFRRLVKPTKFQILSSMSELGDRARVLMKRELLEAGLWEEEDA